MTEVHVPAGLWDTNTVPEGVVSAWYFDNDAAVEAGVVIAVIMVEKTEYDIEAPASGKLHILTETNGVVTPGSLIAQIET